jgi:Bacterial mobilisation protein (MobC)
MARHRQDFAGERYSEHFSLQLTPSQRRALECAAEAQGAVLADFVRSYLPLGEAEARGVCRRCHEQKIDLVLALNRIGVNINQLAHHANAERRMPEARWLEQALAKLNAVLEQILDSDSGAED